MSVSQPRHRSSNHISQDFNTHFTTSPPFSCILGSCILGEKCLPTELAQPVALQVCWPAGTTKHMHLHARICTTCVCTPPYICVCPHACTHMPVCSCIAHLNVPVIPVPCMQLLTKCTAHCHAPQPGGGTLSTPVETMHTDRRPVQQ
jgi:hypothetical protein